jgi:uncharacterized protein (TIGR03790 family)
MNRRTLAVCLLALTAATAQAEVGPKQVLLVINDSSAVSQAIGAYYQSVRGIPALNVMHLATSTSEVIDRGTYNTQVRDPIGTYLTVTHPELQAQIKFLVLTKDVPLIVVGGSTASVDSELTQIFTGRVPDSGVSPRLGNPYFMSLRPFDAFSEPGLISYLVFRLDGYQTQVDPGTGVPGDIKRLIDDAQHPATSGTFVLDATSGTGMGNDWMATAATDLTDMGVPVVYDTNPSIFLKNQPNIIGYCSWGSNDPSDAGPPYYGEVPPGSGDFYPGTFLTGALTTDYVSTSGRTFIDGNQNYGQSLTADLIRIGAAGGNGHVAEPFLDAVARPHFLFRDYLEGFLAGEAYYQSFAYLHWMNVVVVDPLMKSGIHVGLPPVLNSISNNGPHQGGTVITLSGRDFTNPDLSTITFDGIPSPTIDTLSRTQMTCVTPALEPGIYDVRVTTPFGQSQLTDAYLSLPAMVMGGTPGIGQQISITTWDQPLSELFMFLSLGTATIPVPPFGKLLLDPTLGFRIILHAQFSFLSTFTITGTIPDDPGLHGLTFYLQGLVGPSVPNLQAYFTNRVDVAIP